MEQKTVFISYRRDKSKHLARSIYMDLTHHGWDVFLDVTTIDSGNFDQIILNQIGARAHFILLISPGSMERCVNAGDWLLREIEEAVRLDRNIIPIIESGVDFDRETSFLPDDLRAIVRKKNGLPLHDFYFESGMDALRARFLKTPEYVRIQAAPATDHAEVQRRMAEVTAELQRLLLPTKPAPPHSFDLVPAPFDWIEIPGKGYSLAKYPVTNAQFARFIEAGGYENDNWWTEAGWRQRKKDGWSEPRYWRDSKWNGADKPVVGVSWYEAVAFCLWISDVTGEKIMLPTEDQWQYAAQGDDGRTYPWGNEWDCTRCNNSVKPCDNNATTPVTHYAGKDKGDSYFGLVDMAGNVQEWCLTDYDNNTNNMNGDANMRVLRGGSWYHFTSDIFRCDCRDRFNPFTRNYFRGFRLARS